MLEANNLDLEGGSVAEFGEEVDEDALDEHLAQVIDRFRAGGHLQSPDLA